MCWRACVSLLLALFLLEGCAGGEAAVSRQDAEEERSGGSLTATQVESAASRSLTDEEIFAAYARAEEAWAWFELSPLPDSGEAVQENGILYRRVNAPGFAKMEDLRTYLRGLFSGELTEELLASGGNQPVYRDIDGVLYVRTAGRVRNTAKGEIQIQITHLDEISCTVDLTVDLLDGDGATVTGMECWSFPYALVDGRWVFTDFRLVY